MAEKVIDVGLTPVEEIMARKLRCIILGYTLGATDLVCLHNGMETVRVECNQANMSQRKKTWIDDLLPADGSVRYGT